MDLTRLFCDVDDFCKDFEPLWKQKLLEASVIQRKKQSSLLLTHVTQNMIFVEI